MRLQHPSPNPSLTLLLRAPALHHPPSSPSYVSPHNHQRRTHIRCATTTSATSSANDRTTATPHPPTPPSAHQPPVYYFAFGSNMASSVLQGRRKCIPLSAEPAVLREYALAFNVRGFPYRYDGDDDDMCVRCCTSTPTSTHTSTPTSTPTSTQQGTCICLCDACTRCSCRNMGGTLHHPRYDPAPHPRSPWCVVLSQCGRLGACVHDRMGTGR